jgi:predicted ferric reductase
MFSGVQEFNVGLLDKGNKSQNEQVQSRPLWKSFGELFALIGAIIVLHYGLFSGSLTMVGNDYLTQDPILQVPNILSVRATEGVGIWILGVVFCPLLTGILLLRLSYLKQEWVNTSSLGPIFAQSFTSLIGAGITSSCAYFAFICWKQLVTPEKTFTLTDPPDALKQFLGGLVFAMYIPLAAASFCVTIILASAQNKQSPTFKKSIFSRMWITIFGDAGHAHQGDSFIKNFPGVFKLLALLVLWGFACVTLTCIWNFSAQSYFQSIAYDATNDISYNMVENVYWTFGPPPSENDTSHVQAIVNVKVYLDVVVYLGTLGCTVVLGFLALQIPWIRRQLNKRLGSVFLPKSLLQVHVDACLTAHHEHAIEEKDANYDLARYDHFVYHSLGLPPTIKATFRRITSIPRELLAKVRDLSVGEAFILSEVLALYCWWPYYWIILNPRIKLEVEGYSDKHELMHIWARVLGHMTTLTMSFLAFPVTRNSVWECAFGIPFERSIVYHRYLGKLTWLLVTIHMLLWQVKWLFEGNLINNMTNQRNLVVTRCEDSPGGHPCFYFNDDDPAPFTSSSLHADNFTIVLAEIAWLLLTVVLFFAVFSRRTNYELFHYTHHAVLVFFLVAILHAWSHWYYTAGGLILYVFDKLARMVKSSRSVEILSMSYAAHITRIVISSSAIGKNVFYSGQYLFLNIPDISLFEWHPFTISSSPSEALSGGGASSSEDPELSTITLNIKNMGPGTWTHKLAMLAYNTQRSNSGLDIQGNSVQQGGINPSLGLLNASIDGPYGRTGLYYERSTLLMVCGGIGITPMHSLIKDLSTRALRPESYGKLGNIKKVRLIWVVRDMSLIHAFASTFYPLIRASQRTNGLFELTLVCTHRPSLQTTELVDEEVLDEVEEEHTSTSFTSPIKGFLARTKLFKYNRDMSAKTLLPEISPIDAGWVDSSTAAAVEAVVQSGRPDLSQIFADVALEARRLNELSSTESLFSHVTAMVCGPEAMMEEVKLLSLKEQMDYHGEVFHF